MTPTDNAPVTVSELEEVLRDTREGLIPVTSAFLCFLGPGVVERNFLFPGVGRVAEHMGTVMQNLAAMKHTGSTEQTPVQLVASQLFKLTYALLDDCLGDGALFADVHMDASTLKHSKSMPISPIKGYKRPDGVLMTRNKVSLAIWEVKWESMEEAVQDMHNYLKGGLPPGYQDIHAILVIAMAGFDVKFGLCDLHGKVAWMSNNIRVNVAGGAIRAMAASLNAYRIMRKLDTLAPETLMAMGLSGKLKTSNDTVLHFGTLDTGVVKTISNFSTYCSTFGVKLGMLKDAYSVKSPFLPVLKEGTPKVEANVYKLQMMTFGRTLKVDALTEEEALRCVYAWLDVCSKLHAKGIVAADLRWPNMMKQQPRKRSNQLPNTVLPWIPLVIDLEQARKANLKPTNEQKLQDWEAGTLVDGKYTCTSDVYQVGVMLQQWLDRHAAASTDVATFVATLKSHNPSAEFLVKESPLLELARSALSGL